MSLARLGVVLALLAGCARKQEPVQQASSAPTPPPLDPPDGGLVYDFAYSRAAESSRYYYRQSRLVHIEAVLPDGGLRRSTDLTEGWTKTWSPDGRLERVEQTRSGARVVTRHPRSPAEPVFRETRRRGADGVLVETVEKDVRHDGHFEPVRTTAEPIVPDVEIDPAGKGGF